VAEVEIVGGMPRFSNVSSRVGACSSVGNISFMFKDEIVLGFRIFDKLA